MDKDRKETGKAAPFGMRDKVGYLLGDLGNDFTFLLSSGFLMKFYTDVMGVDGFVVGLVMTVARFVDAFTDVAMGRLCDRSRVTSAGKFKPWLRRMSGPVAVASFLIYQSGLANRSMGFKVAWLFVTYILWGSVFYTAVNIPYGSMASSVSPDPGDRQSLSTYRSMGGTLAGVIVGAGIPMAAYDTQQGRAVLNGSRFTAIAGIFSVLAVVCYLLCYHLTTERVRPRNDVQNRDSIGSMLKDAFKNRALISVIAASVVMLLAQLTMQSMANYVYPNYYGNTAAQSASTLVMLVAMLAAAACAKPLAAAVGKAELSGAASLFAGAVCVVLFFLRPSNVWVYVGLITLSWLGLGIFNMVSWALITDVIDDQEVRTGIRSDGSVYAMYSFARKLGQAGAAALTGGMLSFIGYSQSTAFDHGVLEGIYTISTIIPAVGFGALGLILWLWYPLHKKQVQANVAALAQRNQDKGE